MRKNRARFDSSVPAGQWKLLHCSLAYGLRGRKGKSYCPWKCGLCVDGRNKAGNEALMEVFGWETEREARGAT